MKNTFILSLTIILIIISFVQGQLNKNRGTKKYLRSNNIDNLSDKGISKFNF
jgi:hypothetical protein